MRLRPQAGQVHLRFLWKLRFCSSIFTLQRLQYMNERRSRAPVAKSGPGDYIGPIAFTKGTNTAMAKLILYHNPRCSKSREALALLQEKKADVEVVEYLDAPLAKAKIAELLKQLGGDPMQLLRTKDKKYEAAGLDPKKTLTPAQVADVLSTHGELMERPVVTKGNRAVIGRPPERVLELL